MGYVGARVEAVAEDRRRRVTVLVSGAFFVGVVLSLVSIGVAASLVGHLFAAWSFAFAAATALVSFAAGIAALLGPMIRASVTKPNIPNRGGIAGAFLYGLLYTVATVTTGAGPLFLLLTVTAAIGRPIYGAALSFAYGVGRGLPFLLLGLFAGAVGAWLAHLDRFRRATEVVSGVALIAIGGYFAWLAHALVTS
ncbi:MAG: thiol:disulfide interchange protein [Acidobacteriota bacterium]|nr:thiol:disulfide interchange protein [Acidobacteriota bacterium]